MRRPAWKRHKCVEAQYREIRAPFGFRTPDEVIYDMSRQLTDCEVFQLQGTFCKKAIMQYAQLKKLNVTVEDIYTGNGVSGSL